MRKMKKVRKKDHFNINRCSFVVSSRIAQKLK